MGWPKYDPNLPSIIKESVPKVKDASRPTAKVELIAKELSPGFSSNDGFGSVKGLSVDDMSFPLIDIVRYFIIILYLHHQRKVLYQKEGCS